MPEDSANPPTDAPAGTPRLRFSRRYRLSGSTQFSHVFKAGLRKAAGPLILIAVPNSLGHHRLGLSIGRRVGGAVRRVAVKRRLREAFRLSQAELPAAPSEPNEPGAPGEAGRGLPVGGYDWVIVAKPHAPMPTQQYQELFVTLADRVSREWHKRASR